MATTMNWNDIADKWAQFGGEVKKQWGMFTEDEAIAINGDRDVLTSKIQEKYNIPKEYATRQIDKWANKLKL